MTNNLNGWQRLWLVLTVLWLLPIVALAIAWVADGGLREYTPPKLASWTIECPAPALQLQKPLSEAHRRTLDGIVGKMTASAESEANIQLVVDEYKKKHAELTPLEQQFVFWVPEGSTTDDVRCSHLDLSSHMYSDTLKKIRPPVFARLEPWGRFHTGLDLDTALASDTKWRVKASREQRQAALLFGLGAAVSVPMTLYVLGWSVAWIRRGFRRES